MPGSSATAENSPFNVMVVDDTPENLYILTGILRQHGCEVSAMLSGTAALVAAEKNPPDLILLDVTMPEMDGYQVCKSLKANSRLADIPVIFLSALNTPEDKIKGFQAGGVDFVTKPFYFDEVKARVDTHIKLHRLQSQLAFQNQHLQKLVDEKVRELSEAQLATIFALAKLAQGRDDETGSQLERVQIYCRALADHLRADSPYSQQMNSQFISLIYHAAPLHDIGKVAIPDSILLKPGKLTPEEFEIMKTHAAVGEATLSSIAHQHANDFVQMGIEIAGGHHERWDGTGYPRGLAGEAIPLSARIMAVVDVYDALRSERCYKQAIEHTVAVQMIRDAAGSHFDPVVVHAFLALEHEFDQVRRTVE